MPPTIAVLGAGTMGAGIAQLAAQSGSDVLLYDIKDEFVRRGISNIEAALQRRVERGKLSADERAAILGRIRTSTRRDDAAQSDLIIEAAPEDINLKREIFASLSALSAPETILATNTSSLSITSIASAAEGPERVVGMHFFNPAPAMPLVEVIAGRHTSPEVVQAVAQIARGMEKTPVVAADMPGFIVNRVARPFYGEALKIVGECGATVPQVDAAMRAAGFPMGPFELMDLIGIDINFAVTKSVFEAFFGEPRYRPHPIQQRMVEAGTIGKKAGRGFYDYSGGQKADPTLGQVAPMQHKRAGTFIPHDLTQEFLGKGEITLGTESEEQGEGVARILAMIMNEAAFAYGEGVASVRDIDRAMRLGTNYPKGPLGWADEIGLDIVLKVLRSLQESLGDDRYRPAPLLQHLVASGHTGATTGEGFHHPGERGMV
jgi:3-hydroxybutyryl-CoA dehydrogenase